MKSVIEKLSKRVDITAIVMQVVMNKKKNEKQIEVHYICRVENPGVQMALVSKPAFEI